MKNSTKYSIYKFVDGKKKLLIASGLSLDDVTHFCGLQSSSGKDKKGIMWFYGFEKEDKYV